MSNILASGISNIPHLKVFDQIAEERLAEIDLMRLLIYMIDTVNADALPILAEQFDVLGYKGWRFVTDNTVVVPSETILYAFKSRVLADSGTFEADSCLLEIIESLAAVDFEVPDPAFLEAQQRELIKSAIELHRYKGTPWSIKEALRRIGFGGAEILEGVGQFYDGSFFHNAAVTYSGLANWACFRVIFDLGNLKGINEQQTVDLQALIAEYKNARSRLVDLAFSKSINDTVNMVDEVGFKIVLPAINDGFTPYYNLEFIHTGVIEHTGYAEEFTITQIT
jgi:P2-related tail formation protein